MRKLFLKCSLVIISLYSLAHLSWLQAATVAMASPNCSDELLSAAHSQLAEQYYSISSDPIIACLHEPTLGLTVNYGRTDFAFGLPSVILIGPKGTNTDVIAHEWSHAELEERVGFLYRFLNIPTWFDEGLAMQVDHRADFGTEALSRSNSRSDVQIPALEVMNTSDFFTSGEQGKYHYSLSKCLVSQWVKNNDNWASQLTSLKRLKIDDIYKNGITYCGNA